MPQLFMSPDGFPKEGQPAFVLEHAAPSAEPRPPEYPVVRLSVSLGEDRRRRGTKSSPVRVKVSPPIPLSSAQTDGARARAVAVPWEMDAQKFSFRIYAAQSVGPPLRILFTHSLCRCARRRSLMRQLCPILQSCIGRKEAAPTPFPSQMLEQSGNSWGNFASLARSLDPLCKPNGIGPICAFASNSL